MNKERKTSRILAVVLAISLVVNLGMTHVSANTGSEKTELTLSDFGIVDGEINGQEKLYSASGTLKDTSIEAVYNFSYGGNSVYYGAQWQGFMMEPKNGGLSFLLVDLNKSSDAEKYQSVGEITSDEANMTLVETERKIRVSFAYSNIAGNTADVAVTVQVADGYSETYHLSSVNTDILGRNIFLYSRTDAPLTYKSVVEEEDTTVYETITLENLGIVDGTITNDTKYYSVNGNLKDTSIEAIFNFSEAGNSVYYGGSWQGFMMEPKNGELSFMFVDLNKPDAEKYQNMGTITPGEADCILLGTDLKVKISFAFTDIKERTADVRITVQVADGYKEVYTLDDANLDIVARGMMFYSNVDCPMSYKSVKATDEEPEEDTTVYETITLENLGIADETITNDTKYYSVNGNLKDTSIEAIFNFSEAGNSVYYGGNWQGFMMEPKNGELSFMFVDLNKSDAEKYQSLGSIASSEANAILIGTDLKVKVSFAFTDIKERTADVRITVQVADGYKEVYTLDDANLDIVARGMMFYSNVDCPMSYKSVKATAGEDPDTPEDSDTPEDPDTPEVPEEDTTVYETITLKTLGVVDGTTTNDTQYYQGGGSLKDTEIVATYNFSESGNAVYYGAQWQGFMMEPKNGGLSFMFVDLNKPDAEKYKTIGDITAEEAAMQLIGTDVKIRVAFAYSNISGNTADVRITVQMADGYQEVYQLLGINTEILGRNVLLWSAENCPISYNSIKIESDVAGVKKPKLTKVTLKQTGIVNAKYSYTDGNLVARGDYGKSLINTVLTQKMTFSKHADTWFHFGALESPWHGVRFMTDSEGMITIVGAGEEFVERYQLRPEIAGTELLGKELTWKLELFENGKDAYLGVSINGKLYNDSYFKLTDAADKFGGLVSIYVGNKNGYLQVGTPEAAPTLNENFAKLTFDSFDIATDKYGYNNGDLAVQGYCGMDRMDKVVFSDTIMFSKTVGAQLRIFGKETPWYGMILEAIGDGKLKLSDASGVFEPIIFDSETAGTELIGKSIDLTFSFEYVDSDDDGKKDDVKMGVWFNGKSYANRWFYLQDSAENLGGYALVYCPNKDTYIKITTYMVPIDFTIWGFTVRWMYELGLIR